MAIQKKIGILQIIIIRIFALKKQCNSIKLFLFLQNP